MRIIFAALIIISVGIATSYAGGIMLLHVGDANGNGGGGAGCGPTGLKFNVACNSQYTTVIHF